MSGAGESLLSNTASVLALGFDMVRVRNADSQNVPKNRTFVIECPPDVGLHRPRLPISMILVMTGPLRFLKRSAVTFSAWRF